MLGSTGTELSNDPFFFFLLPLILLLLFFPFTSLSFLVLSSLPFLNIPSPPSFLCKVADMFPRHTSLCRKRSSTIILVFSPPSIYKLYHLLKRITCTKYKYDTYDSICIRDSASALPYQCHCGGTGNAILFQKARQEGNDYHNTQIIIVAHASMVLSGYTTRDSLRERICCD